MSSRLIALSLIVAASCTIGVAASSAATPGDVAAVGKIDLRLADLPAGWSARAGSSSDTGCFSGPSKLAASAFVRAQVYLAKGGQNEVTGQVSAYATIAAARRALVRVSGAAPLACYRKKLPPQLTKGGVTVTSFSCGALAPTALGDHRAASRCIIGLKNVSATGQLYIDSIFVQRGRFLIGDGFLSEVGRPALSGELALVAKAVARVPATS